MGVKSPYVWFNLQISLHRLCETPRERAMEMERENYKMHADVEDGIRAAGSPFWIFWGDPKLQSSHGLL